MGIGMRDVMGSARRQLRFHPIDVHLRGWLGDESVVSTDRAVLVWEPRHVVPTYAVPAEDVDAEGVDAPGADLAPGDGPVAPSARAWASQHTAPGRALTLRTGQGDLVAAAYAYDDPALAGLLALDFAAFDRWTEEDAVVLGHPQDPFHRVTCRETGRHVVVSAEGVPLAETRRAVLLLETGLPGRWYLPRDDVRMDLLDRTDTHTTCAYKGVAAYYSARVGDTVLADLAWTYEDPLPEAYPVADRLCFWSERTDLELDGQPVPRPVTPWSRSR